jgi:hypothetical protein
MSSHLPPKQRKKDLPGSHPISLVEISWQGHLYSVCPLLSCPLFS